MANKQTIEAMKKAVIVERGEIHTPVWEGKDTTPDFGERHTIPEGNLHAATMFAMLDKVIDQIWDAYRHNNLETLRVEWMAYSRKENDET